MLHFHSVLKYYCFLDKRTMDCFQLKDFSKFKQTCSCRGQILSQTFKLRIPKTVHSVPVRPALGQTRSLQRVGDTTTGSFLITSRNVANIASAFRSTSNKSLSTFVNCELRRQQHRQNIHQMTSVRFLKLLS